MSVRALFSVGVLWATLAGCSGDGSTPRLPVFPVTGKVTMLGRPLPGALVGFAPIGKQVFAMGRTNDEGVYSLMTYDTGDGASVGEFSVTVTKPTLSTAAPIPSGPTHGANGVLTMTAHAARPKAGKAGEEGLLPGRYSAAETTPLKFTVKADNNVFDIDIKLN